MTSSKLSFWKKKYQPGIIGTVNQISSVKLSFLRKCQLLIIGPVQIFKWHHQNCCFEKKYRSRIIGAVHQISSANSHFCENVSSWQIWVVQIFKWLHYLGYFCKNFKSWLQGHLQTVIWVISFSLHYQEKTFKISNRIKEEPWNTQKKILKRRVWVLKGLLPNKCFLRFFSLNCRAVSKTLTPYNKKQIRNLVRNKKSSWIKS